MGSSNSGTGGRRRLRPFFGKKGLRTPKNFEKGAGLQGLHQAPPAKGAPAQHKHKRLPCAKGAPA